MKHTHQLSSGFLLVTLAASPSATAATKPVKVFIQPIQWDAAITYFRSRPRH